MPELAPRVATAIANTYLWPGGAERLLRVQVDDGTATLELGIPEDRVLALSAPSLHALAQELVRIERIRPGALLACLQQQLRATLAGRAERSGTPAP